MSSYWSLEKVTSGNDLSSCMTSLKNFQNGNWTTNTPHNVDKPFRRPGNKRPTTVAHVNSKSTQSVIDCSTVNCNASCNRSLTIRVVVNMKRSYFIQGVCRQCTILSPLPWPGARDVAISNSAGTPLSTSGQSSYDWSTKTATMSTVPTVSKPRQEWQ